MSEFEQLVEYFRKLPGVGRRQAERFAHFVVRSDSSFSQKFADSLISTKNSAQFCTQCQRLTFSLSSDNLCTICKASERDETTLMIVEKDADLNHIEKSGAYTGVYFVLGGVLPMKTDQAQSLIRIDELKKQLVTLPYKEIILALSITPEGEYTTGFLMDEIGSLYEKDSPEITLLGRGLSVGSELEYSDKDTIRYALNSRK